jgi:multidrug efflux pump subunit AcrA (membrane-fusion protein)
MDQAQQVPVSNRTETTRRIRKADSCEASHVQDGTLSHPSNTSAPSDEHRPPSERARRLIGASLVVFTLLLAVTVFAWLVYTAPEPLRVADASFIPRVDVLTVTPTEADVPVVGYGTVRAKNQVDIVPQVSGQLVHVHRNLAVGKVIPKGELLFEVASDVYEARVKQVEAEIRGLDATLARHGQEGASLDERIGTLEKIVEIERRDYETVKELFEREGVGTERDVDMVFQKYLRQRDILHELRNRRDLIPHLQAETQARLDAARAKLAQAEQDLDNTKIRCPFKARVDVVGAYKSQVVTAFFTIARLTDMEAFEISVGIDPRELRWLDPTVRPEAIRGDATGVSPPVTVRWALHDQEYTWRGHVTRFERVDERTRTARMIVEVRDVDMIASVETGSTKSGPELAIGMYCKTELPAERLEGALLVPRHAVHPDGHRSYVYVFKPDPEGGNSGEGRLVRREVPTLRPMGDSVLVDYTGRSGTEVCELRSGEYVVVSQLDKPIEGMRIGLSKSVETDQESVASQRNGMMDWNFMVGGLEPVAAGGIASLSNILGVDSVPGADAGIAASAPERSTPRASRGDG